MPADRRVSAFSTPIHARSSHLGSAKSLSCMSASVSLEHVWGSGHISLESGAVCILADLFTRVNPSPKEVAEQVSMGVAEGRLIILVGQCSVEYLGRSSSRLGLGDRLVIIKQDRSVLVHRKTGYDAVNWQPPKCVISVKQTGDTVTLSAYRPKHRENLVVSLPRVYLLASVCPEDDAKFEMLLTEKELYKAILAHPYLVERGLRIVSSQREIGEGVADFSATDSKGNYVVVEVKKDPVGPEAVKQLYKYVSTLRKGAPSARGILLSPGITKSAKKLLTTLGLEFRKLDLKEIARMAQAESGEGLDRLDRHLGTSSPPNPDGEHGLR